VNLSELRTALKERREDFSQSSAKLNRRINQAYLDICSRRKWGWLRRNYSFATYAFDNTTFTVDPATYNDRREIVVVGASVPTVLGKRIRIDGDFYRVESLDSGGNTWLLDRPLRASLPGGGATHQIMVIYDEVALPVGTKTVVEAVILSGATSYPGSMQAITPAEMAHFDKDVFGSPSNFSVSRKEPIPAPRVAPTVALSFGGTLAAGTYEYWYTHVDKQTGAESALGPSSSVTTDSAGNNVVTIGTDTARTDFFLRLYRSLAGGSTPYLLKDFQSTSSGSLVDSTTDDFLSIRAPDSASSAFIQLYPAPDGEYKITCVTHVEALALGDDADRPIFDADSHHVILSGAEALMLDASDEQGRAGQARMSFERGIVSMIQNDRLNQQQRAVFGGRPRARGKRTWWYGAGGS